MGVGCVWTWNGIGWNLSDPFACTLGRHCATPARNGNFIGDTEVTNCVQDG